METESSETGSKGLGRRDFYMNGWTPLHQRIVASSVWATPYHVRIAWITLLAVAGRDGTAHLTIGGLARMANIRLEEAADALKVLSEPDADTLTQENEGRRIERVASGWRLLNWESYRVLAKKAVLLEQNREAQAKWRDKKKAGASEGPGVASASEGGGEGQDSGPPIKTPPAGNRPMNLAQVKVACEMEGIPPERYPGLAEEFFDHYEGRARAGANGGKTWVAGDVIITDWRAILRTWRTRRDNKRAEDAANPRSSVLPRRSFLGRKENELETAGGQPVLTNVTSMKADGSKNPTTPTTP